MNKKDFIVFADLPPHPHEDELIKDYIGLGFNVILLTEDSVQMIKDKNLSKDYISAIDNLCKYNIDIWIRNMYNDADYFDNSYPDKSRSNYGTPYTLSERHLTDEFKQFEAVTGFYMADEPYRHQLDDNPSYASFDKLVKLVDFVNSYYPNYFFHMNMVPSSSWDHYYQKGNGIIDYKDFIDDYIATIVGKVKSNQKSICLDNYPFIGDKYIEPTYLYDLLTVANATRDYNLSKDDNSKATFGICVQAFDCYSPLRDRHRDILSPSEISFQVLTGLCLNARLFEYFAFKSLSDGSISGIYDKNNKKRLYDIVKSGNEYAFQFFNCLINYQWLGADFYHGYVKEFSNPIHNAKNLFYKNHKAIKRLDSEYDVLLGCFENDEEIAYLILNYTDPQKNHSNEVEMELDGVKELSIFNGKEQKTINYNIFKVTLNPGEGVFISFKKPL